MNKKYIWMLIIALNPYWIWWLANGFPVEHTYLLALAGIASSGSLFFAWLFSRI